MQKNIKKMLSMILTLAMVLTLLVPQTEVFAKAKVKKLTISDKKITLVAGKKANLSIKAKIKGKKKAKAIKANKVKWTSSDKSVATVNKKGKITAKKKGTATITAKYSGKTAKCVVTVKAKGDKDDGDGGDGGDDGNKPGDGGQTGQGVNYTISQTSATMDSGNTLQLNLLGDGKAVYGVTWASSNESIATVDNTGLVTGQSDGTAKISATVNGTTKECEVKVNGFVYSRDLTIQYGTKICHIDFDLATDSEGNPDPAEVAELQAQGCTVVGKNVTKDQVCETAKYIFKKLPKTQVEIESMLANAEPDDTVDSKVTGKTNYGGFNVTAATVCAANAFAENPEDPKKDPLRRNHAVRQMFEFLNGPYEDDNLAMVNLDQGCRSVLDALQLCGTNPYRGFFEGATHKNNYTPNVPYVLNMYKGPYFIDEKQTITGTRPTTYMILIPGRDTTLDYTEAEKCEGYATDKYVDVWYSTTAKRWFTFKDNYKAITENQWQKPEKTR